MQHEVAQCTQPKHIYRLQPLRATYSQTRNRNRLIYFGTFLNDLLFLSFERHSYNRFQESQRTTETRDCPFTSSLPKRLQVGLDQAKAKRLELHPSLPHGWERTKYLDHILLLSHVYQKRFSQEVESWDLNKYSYNILPLMYQWPNPLCHTSPLKESF